MAGRVAPIALARWGSPDPAIHACGLCGQEVRRTLGATRSESHGRMDAQVGAAPSLPSEHHAAEPSGEEGQHRDAQAVEKRGVQRGFEDQALQARLGHREVERAGSEQRTVGEEMDVHLERAGRDIGWDMDLRPEQHGSEYLHCIGVIYLKRGITLN